MSNLKLEHRQSAAGKVITNGGHWSGVLTGNEAWEAGWFIRKTVRNYRQSHSLNATERARAHSLEKAARELIAAARVVGHASIAHSLTRNGYMGITADAGPYGSNLRLVFSIAGGIGP